MTKTRRRNYEILAEYYYKDNLVSYMIKTSKGNIIEVKKTTLEKWEQSYV